MITIPLKTGRGLNSREHWRARVARVRVEREAVGFMLNGQTKPATPCLVELTRIAPSNGLDDDNLVGSLKAVRDQVAHWLGIDDKRSELVRYTYSQRRGPWAVEIEFRRRVIVKTGADGSFHCPAGLLGVDDILEIQCEMRPA